MAQVGRRDPKDAPAHYGAIDTPVVEEPALPPLKTDASFFVICLLILTGDTARGVLFPTLWPRVQSMGGNRITQGITVAAFSFGRVLSSPHLGRWSSRQGYRKVLTVTSIIILIGSLMNTMATTSFWLIAAQIVVGVGSGTLGVTRSFVAQRTEGNERSAMIARLTAVQYSGFTVTPLIGSFLAWYFGDYDAQFGPFHLNAYTSPAFFMVLLSALGAVLLNTCFEDYIPEQFLGKAKYAPLRQSVEAGVKDEEGDQEEAKEREDMDFRSVSSWTEIDWCIFSGLLLNVATKGSVGVFETMGVGVATQRFGMTPSVAGLVVSGCGAVGVTALLFNKPMVDAYHDTGLMVGGVLVMIVSCLFMLKWWPHGDWQFVLSIFTMYASGYPIGHTAVLTWFSKLSKQASQGFLQGWFGSAGSLGRILLPAISGVIAEYFGYDTLFLCLGGFLFLTWLSIVLNYSLFTRLTM